MDFDLHVIDERGLDLFAADGHYYPFTEEAMKIFRGGLLMLGMATDDYAHDNLDPCPDIPELYRPTFDKKPTELTREERLVVDFWCLQHEELAAWRPHRWGGPEDDLLPGIAVHKLQDPWGWFITREECQEAMDALEKAKRQHFAEQEPSNSDIYSLLEDALGVEECARIKDDWLPARFVDFIGCIATGAKNLGVEVRGLRYNIDTDAEIPSAEVG